MSMSVELSAQVRRAFQTLTADLTRVFGDRLIAVVAYAPTRAAAFTRTLDASDLDALSVLADVWHKSGLETPLLLTAHEFERSLDAFPLEYHAIIDRHVVITGTPPFAGVSVRREELRRACEVQAKGHLVHLRQSWVDAGGHGDALMHRLADSALPLRVLLAHVAALDGQAGTDLAAFGAARCGANADVLRAVLALEEHPENARALLPRVAEYLQACEQIWTFVDGWRA
jgi:hypothetical protein